MLYALCSVGGSGPQDSSKEKPRNQTKSSKKKPNIFSTDVSGGNSLLKLERPRGGLGYRSFFLYETGAGYRGTLCILYLPCSP